jgi:UV DNA damage endonuclease
VTTRFGYCCINTTLQKEGVTCNRTMRKATFEIRGLKYASELLLLNIKDLEKIVRWNFKNGIEIFRISSDIAPWASEYDILDLPNVDEIISVFDRIGNFVKQNNVRLSMHPGQFNCLASSSESVVSNSFKDLIMHGAIMDLLGLPRDHSAPINIHVGGAYGDPKSALERWCLNFDKLPTSVRSRLTLENDDKRNMFSIPMLYEGAYKTRNIPLVFDSLHYTCGPQDSSYDEALSLAVSTWPVGIRPVCHHSSAKKIWEDEKTPSMVTHADFCYEKFKDLGYSLDVDLEAKAKEQAWFKYNSSFVNN